MNESIHGRIDTHTHLLPAIDDGCASVLDSMRCARMLVDAGYTHAFCTPHIWPSLPGNNIATIPARVIQLQSHLNENRIPLRVLAGAEFNLHAMWPAIRRWPREQIVTYALAGRYILFDFWARCMDDCRDVLHEGAAHLKSLGLTPILAHPERITALQDDHAEIDALCSAGVLLQMNLWCLTEQTDSPIYRTAEILLKDKKYFMFGTDCHNPESLPRSIEGLAIATELVGEEIVRKLTIDHPSKLVPVAR